MREQLIQEIEGIIPYLSEESIVDCFETQMLYDGYLDPCINGYARSEAGEWENARDWLQYRLNCSVGGLSTDELQEALDFWKEDYSHLLPLP
jgi:hypothetical protein